MKKTFLIFDLTTRKYFYRFDYDPVFSFEFYREYHSLEEAENQVHELLTKYHMGESNARLSIIPLYMLKEEI